VPGRANPPVDNWFDGVSQDGSRVFFHTGGSYLSGDTTEFSNDVYSASLTSGYARPKAATPMYAPLVIAYQPCESPNRAHASPLPYGSCAVPVRTSSNLSVGTADSNGAPANSVGYVRLRATPDDGASGSADMGLSLSLSDVRCQPPTLNPCGLANANSGPDYNGELQARITAQVTDKRNGGAGTEAATGTGISVAFTAACAIVPSTTEGALCSAATTLNALAPGAVQTGARAIWELGQVRVFDGGPDGSVATSPNDLFAVQGVFAP